MRLAEILKMRKDIFDCYNFELDQYKCKSILHQNMERNISPWLYTIQFADNVDVSDVLSYLMNNLIEARPVFYSLSAMQIYKKYSLFNQLSKDQEILGISLPTFIGLKNNQIQRVTSVLVNYFNE